MSPLAQLQAFTQSVYLVIKGRYFDDLTSDDGFTLIHQTVDWTNMFIDELETETNPDGTPLNWKWLWQLGQTLGTAVLGEASILTPNTVNYLLADENRYVQVLQDGSAVSNWVVVSPEQITNKSDRISRDMCSQVGNAIVFSRAFKDYENGGTIVGDISTAFPHIAGNTAANGAFSPTNVKILSVVKPKTLLILGVAKNASLPDIVQGGLSPSYAQKYKSLFDAAVARNNVGAVASEAVRDDLSSVAGVY